MTNPPEATLSAPRGGARWERGTALAVAALTLVAFAPTLVELVREWIDRPEYSHGFIMPPVALWILWDRREALKQAKKTTSWVGALLTLPCLALLLLGEMKLSWFLKPYALVGVIAGSVWTLYGWRVFRLCFPAFVVLLLMCPLPGRVERGITLPLKKTAATLATGLLDISGIESTLDGVLIHCAGAVDPLLVAEACSGIRSLISLLSISILVCFFWNTFLLLRLVVVASCIPIAIAVNSLRIWLTGYLTVHVSPEAAQGFFHLFEGFALFGVAAAILLGWALLLSQIFPRRSAA